jgi:hypothetical protein
MDWSSPYTFARNVVGIPTASVLANPPFKSAFVVASGWWDLLSDAPFFFAAGFATIPPRGPFGFAKGEQLPTGDAAYSWTGGKPIVNEAGSPVSGFALGQQHTDASAPEVLVAGMGSFPPGPPITARSFGLQLPADVAPFSFTVGLPQSSNIRPLIGAFGAIQSADTAPFIHTVSRSPLIVVAPPLWIGKVFAEQQPDARSPWSYTTNFLAGASVVPKIPPSVTTRAFGLQLPDSAPAYVFFDLGSSNNISPALQPPPNNSMVFAYTPFDDIAPYIWANGIPLGSTVPPVTAEILSAAIFRIVNANLLVSVPFLYQASNTIPPGYVINTIPPTGSMLPIWSAVEIIVSSGPAFPFGNVSTPNLIGMTAQTARDQVYASKLSLDRYLWAIDPSSAGTVIAQSIAPASVVLPGTVIQLTLSLGPTKPPIPTPALPVPNSS